MNTAKSNPQFTKLINYSLTSLEKLISPDNSDKYSNIHSIIKLDGIKTLSNVASVNVKNDELINKTTGIMKKFLFYDNPKNHELSKFFVEKNGHMDIFQLLISIKSTLGINSLLEIIDKLVQVPQLANILIESGLLETVKFLNDNHGNKIGVNNILYKIMSKVTNHRKGRENIINNKLIPGLLTYIKQNLKSNKAESIFNGLIIMDNICRSEKGKGILKDLNAFEILGETLETFFNDSQIIHKIVKIFSKLVSVKDVLEKINKIKNILSSDENDNIEKNMIELNDILNSISNFMLVQDLGKEVCSTDNIKIIIELFIKLYSIDLQNKNKEFLINYVTLMKYFMLIFKRMMDYDSEYLDENSNKGKLFIPIINNILDCVKKNWQGIYPIIQNDEKDTILNDFKHFFSIYCEIFTSLYNSIYKNNNAILPLIEYILENIIIKSKDNYYKDDKFNYYFSFILKIINEILLANQNIDDLNHLLINCFPYFKNVISNSENWMTLSNFLDLIFSIIKLNINEQIKEDIIPMIIDFMIKKPKFRYPNLVNLKILDIYLTPEFIAEYLSLKNKNKQKDKEINDSKYKLNFIDAICSVMMKGFSDSSSQNKENINENKYVNLFKEERNKETEKKILNMGGKLLKILISNEKFLEKVNLLKKLVKEYEPSKATNENFEMLEDNLIFQICTLSMKEYLNKGMEDVFKAIRDLITKEINYIEVYKREKAKDKETNPEYKVICNRSTKIFGLALATLRKIEDGAIINYNEKKEEKLITLLKQIISLNIEIIDKSTDVENQIGHLKQLKKNASFLYKNESQLKIAGPSVIEQFLNSLMNLLRKNLNEDLCFLIIETFLILSSFNKEIYNLLIKGGCPKLILQFLELTNNNKLGYNALQLLKNICLSKQENLLMFANQNILITLNEIRTRFMNDVKITHLIDQIISEIMKFQNQSVHIKEYIIDAIKNFHEDMKNNFKENKTRISLLNDLLIINSYTTNKSQIKILTSNNEFIQDFIKCVKQTIEVNESSHIIEKLFTCEIQIIKKIKENADDIDDNIHSNFCDFLLKILFHPSIFSESFLLTANTLLIYIKDNNLYYKCLSDKIDEKFIEEFLDQEENYIDNPEISRVINNILSCLALKNPNFAKYIVRKGGLVNIIDNLKTLVNLNDENSMQTKLNGLIMINSLLNEEKNMEVFIQSNGIELINNLIKNDILIKQKNENENELISLEDQYKTLCCINLDTIQKNLPNIKKEKKKNRRKSSNITTDIIIRETITRNSSKIVNNFNNNEVNFEENNNENLEDNESDDNIDMLYCMKIINKGLNKNKNEFIDKETISNLLKISEFYFPEKNIFSQLIEFLSYYIKNKKQINEKNNNIINEKNEKDFLQNKKIIKFALSNRAYYFSNEDISKKAKDIENQIGEILFENNEYISDYKKVLSENYEDENSNNLIYQILTYLSLIIDLPIFKEVFEQIQNEIINFFNQALSKYLSSEKKNNQNIINNNEKQDKNITSHKNEGILLSLIKLYNYFIEQKIIDKNDKKILENIDSFEKIGIVSYSPNNYLFVYEFEREITKLIEQTTGFILEEKKDNDKKKKVIKYTKYYFIHLQNIFNKILCFIEDFCKTLKSQNFIENKNINIKKEDNLENILILVKKYFKTDEDLEKKEESCQILYNTFINLLEILFDEEIYAIYTKNGRISNKLKLLWKLIYYTLENDNKNIILEKISSNNVLDLTEKVKITIKIKENNKPSLRKIPLLIAKKTEVNNEINKILYDFAEEDLNNNGKNDDKIKKLDIEILSYLSKYYIIMKDILLNKKLWKFLKDEYSKTNLPSEERLHLAIIFRNATKNKANLDQLIKNDLNFAQIIFSKVLKDTITSLENNGKQIAETEIESVCNITKNKTYINILEQKNIVNHEELKKIETIYDRLDTNISKSFKPILKEIAVEEKLQKNLQSVHEDEEKINELEQFITTNYEKHVLEFMKFFDRNKKEESLLDTIVKDELLIEGKKKILSVNELKEENKNKGKIKTPLSIKTNDKMYPALSQILLIIIKNYNLLNTFKEDIYNVKRILLINKSLNLLQKISLSQDNHEAILEEGLINLLEKMCEDYNNERIKGVNNDDNSYLSNFISKGKFILKECSNTENSTNIILDSPIFSSIVSEMLYFNENPKIINSNSNIKKIFIYDNSIITNVCMISKSYEQIINKLGIELILKLGTKTGNIILLENIINMIIFYIGISSKKAEIKLNDNFYDSVFAVMEKCLRNKNRSSILMSKTLNLASLLYSPNNKQKVDKLKLFESINNDIDIFSTDVDYLFPMLTCLCILVKDNPQNIDECFEIELVKKVKKNIHDLTKEYPENYSKIICKLTEFYYYLVKDKQIHYNKLCEFEVTRNVVKYIDIFNRRLDPKSEQEKELEVQQNQLDMLNNSIDEEINKKDKDNVYEKENVLNDEIFDSLSISSKIPSKKPIKVNYVRGIMLNSIRYLDKVTSSPEVNKYISANTSFNSYIVISIKNENNDNNYLVIALHCFGNYLLSEAGKSFLRTKLVDIYQLLKNLQSKYYSNSGILINVNYISGSIIMNQIDKNYAKMFFDLIAESIRFQDWNINLIKMSLKIINESLDKNSFLINLVNDNLISNIINILKTYKDDYEIQLNCYKILSYFANDEHTSSFSSMINKLLQQIKHSLNRLLIDNKGDKNIKEKIKKAINNLIIFLGNIEQYSDNITNELIIPFIKELNDFGLDEESHGPYILNIFDNLFKNKIFIEPFVLNKGLDSLIKVMKSIDNNYNNVSIILQLFSILKQILIVSDEYKLQMQNLKIPDIINNIIKYTTTLDKKIDYEGKSLLFIIKKAKAKLEVVEEVDFTEIKIVEPIRSVVKNYLTSGKQFKLINEHGEVKEKQLLFTQDLLKVQAKLINSNFPPKSKYVIETNNIKAIIKGYGTDAFKKSGGLFRSIPKPELCFSIIGPKTEEGITKTLNVVCKNESEVNRWISYMEEVIRYFQKKNLLGNVEIKKSIKG